MHPYAAYPLAALLGYLLGTSNMAYYLARRKGVDLRAGGSGNLGASNAVTLLGWKTGVLVGLHDIGKAVLAVFLARSLFPGLPHAGVTAGVGCVLGHIFPFYLRFRGGKGFAADRGMIAALNWKFALAIGVAIVLIVLVTDYIVLGTMTTVISFPIFCAATSHFLMAGLLCVASLVIVFKHRANLVRIYHGTEIGVRAAGRGEHRVS